VHEQRYGALDRADVQRLVAGVEDQDAAGVEVRQRRAEGGARDGRTATWRAVDDVVLGLGEQAFQV
jgi:hypothetical protein